MSIQRRKRVSSVILSVIAFACLIADSTDRLQKVVSLMPPQHSAYLPVVYGVLFLIAVLLLMSSHKDDLEALRQPDVASLHEANTRHGNSIALQEERLRTVAPRQLTHDQAIVIVSRLKPLNDAREKNRASSSTMKGGTVVAVHAVGHDDGYARQLQDAMRAANFHVSEWDMDKHRGIDYYYGITVRWNSDKAAERGEAGIGDAVASVLREAGIEVEVKDYPDVIALELIVGARRPAVS